MNIEQGLINVYTLGALLAISVILLGIWFAIESKNRH